MYFITLLPKYVNKSEYHHDNNPRNHSIPLVNCYCFPLFCIHSGLQQAVD